MRRLDRKGREICPHCEQQTARAALGAGGQTQKAPAMKDTMKEGRCKHTIWAVRLHPEAPLQPAGRTGGPGPNPLALREQGEAQLCPERGQRPSEPPGAAPAASATPPQPRAVTHKRRFFPPLSYLRTPPPISAGGGAKLGGLTSPRDPAPKSAKGAGRSGRSQSPWAIWRLGQSAARGACPAAGSGRERRRPSLPVPPAPLAAEPPHRGIPPPARSGRRGVRAAPCPSAREGLFPAVAAAGRPRRGRGMEAPGARRRDGGAAP